MEQKISDTVNTEPLQASLVRIFSSSGRVVGAGFLLSNERFVTCAHVVTQALGLTSSPEVPTDKVRFDLPYLKSDPLDATVEVWRPPTSDDADSGDDLAILRITGQVPNAATPVRLLHPKSSQGHNFLSYGFPEGFDSGVLIDGTIAGQNAGGWIQLGNLKEFVFEGGCSGGPVWDKTTGGVIGMTVIGDEKREVGFAIPSTAVKIACPALQLDESQLAPSSIEAAIHSLSNNRILIQSNAVGILWQGTISAEEIGVLWQGGKTDYTIGYSPYFSKHPILSAVLLRLALHGKGGTLQVTDPQDWRQQTVRILGNCLGTQWDGIGPDFGANLTEKWRLEDFAQPSLATHWKVTQTHSASDLANIINGCLDKWILEDIENQLFRVLHDLNFTTLRFPVEKQLAKAMKTTWHEWLALLRGDSNLLRHFLEVLLSTETDDQREHGLARAGCRTAASCLLRSVIFVLAIKVALNQTIIPTLGQYFENISILGGKGHLCGLELIDGLELAVKINSLMWKSNIVLLPHSTDSPETLLGIVPSLQDAGTRPGRFDKVAIRTTLFLTGEAGLKRAIGEGAGQLGEHVKRAISEWNIRQTSDVVTVSTSTT